MDGLIQGMTSNIRLIPDYEVMGTVTAVKGLLIECTGVHHLVSIGSHCTIINRQGRKVVCEVVGVRGDTSLLMAFDALEGVGTGCKAIVSNSLQSGVYPNDEWRGRIINAMGDPIDGKGPLPQGKILYPYKNTPPLAGARQRVHGKIDLGVRALNNFVTCCKGQRLGIFAGSGVGKSVLISMLTRYCDADVKVIGLIGERGREVQEFVQDYLGEEGLKQAVVIVATSDEMALMRRQAAYLTLSISEYFRDQGMNVLCLMDSVTRFAMSQREIGLSAGEPPASKGYTPSVFSELPKLLERAGPGIEKGTITGLFSVLVDGDDHNEPISDAVRGILDGHIVLDRKIAERGRFPAIDVLRSISRMLPMCNTDQENAIVTRARALLSIYSDMEDMIRLGAYRKGADPKVDEAINYYPALEKFLAQNPKEQSTLEAGYEQLAEILGMKINNT
ncbi:MAG: fliI [Rickettsiales bacterium]|jgi:flagellum-specific ATP synthase|nr:fliI [Rickettsiales bacterium]